MWHVTRIFFLQIIAVLLLWEVRGLYTLDCAFMEYRSGSTVHVLVQAGLVHSIKQIMHHQPWTEQFNIPILQSHHSRPKPRIFLIFHCKGWKYIWLRIRFEYYPKNTNLSPTLMHQLTCQLNVGFSPPASIIKQKTQKRGYFLHSSLSCCVWRLGVFK